MKIIFMGTPEFSVETLQAIHEAGHEIVCVVTQPDKPRDRGKSVQYPPVKEYALMHQLPIFQPVKVREPECVNQLKSYEADLFVVVAFGQILTKEILEMPKFGCINVHASLLPKYRGAAPIQWAILDGEKRTGVTIMQMDEGIDTGDMLAKAEVSIEQSETGGSLHDKLAKVGANLCVETIKQLEAGNITGEKQDDSLSCYAKRLDKKMGNIDWNQDAVQIERQIRGLNPWPSAYSFLNGKTLKIWRATVQQDFANAEPGEVVLEGKTGLYVQTKCGALKLDEVQLEGKRRMYAEEFLRGFKVEEGTILRRER